MILAATLTVPSSDGALVYGPKCALRITVRKERAKRSDAGRRRAGSWHERQVDWIETVQA